MGLVYPDGRTFAFTIMDDTDVSTLANVAPIYRLLDRLGMRTTKTVWPLGCPEGSPDFQDSDTLEDPPYLEFVLDLKRRGFEIAHHGATMESSPRQRTVRALDRFRDIFGASPRVYANHALNQDNLYWGAERFDDPILRTLVRRTEGRPPGYYQGHIPGSPFWWGDLAGDITYIRNLTFNELNLRRINPSMPYKDPRRPAIPWWFSASDAEDVSAFNALVSPKAQDKLEREGGFTIIATHFGKGFVRDGVVDAEAMRLLERLSKKPGWFVPVGVLLDWLRADGAGGNTLAASEWRRMQWRWGWDLVRRKWRRRRQPSAGN